MPLPGRLSEMVWTLVPAVALAVVLAFTWRAIRTTESALERNVTHWPDGWLRRIG